MTIIGSQELGRYFSYFWFITQALALHNFNSSIYLTFEKKDISFLLAFVIVLIPSKYTSPLNWELTSIEKDFNLLIISEY